MIQIVVERISLLHYDTELTYFYVLSYLKLGQ